MSDQTAGKIPVGISACLTGQKVRYNGGHKQSRYCLDVLQDCFEFKTFCPEVAAGLGIPREPIRLVGLPDELPRALGTNDPSLDATDDLLAVGTEFARQNRELRGFILMKGSPAAAWSGSRSITPTACRTPPIKGCLCVRYGRPIQSCLLKKRLG